MKEKKTKVGRTVRTKDTYLPIEKVKGKSKSNPKEKRWIAVIAVNEKGELAVVRLTTEKQANTTELKNYDKGNGKTTYFKHFVEINDNQGKPIRIDGVRFIENPPEKDLTQSQVDKVKDKVLNHSKQSQENRKKIAELKVRTNNKDKKKR